MSKESGIENDKKNLQSEFEKNLMSDLTDEYRKKGKKVPFDFKKLRRSHAKRGFGITGWKDDELQKRLDHLVEKGLIDLGNGKYQISDKGIKWKDDTKPPFSSIE